MDRLAADPRTASIGGDKSARRQLAKVADQLLAELRPDESASWVLASATLVPALGVITNKRLLLIPLILGRPVEMAAAPYRVEMGKKRLIGQSVEVMNAYGARVSLLLQLNDLVKVQAAADAGPASAAAHGNSQAQPNMPPPPTPSAGGCRC